MVILSCSVIVVELVVDKRTMQQLTEHFKFSSRHGGIRPSFSLRRMGAADENIVLIRFYRKKFTLAAVSLSEFGTQRFALLTLRSIARNLIKRHFCINNCNNIFKIAIIIQYAFLFQ